MQQLIKWEKIIVVLNIFDFVLSRIQDLTTKLKKYIKIKFD